MQSEDEIEVVSKAKLWTGRVITILTFAFLLFDAIVKVLNLPVAVEGKSDSDIPLGWSFTWVSSSLFALQPICIPVRPRLEPYC